MEMFISSEISFMVIFRLVLDNISKIEFVICVPSFIGHPVKIIGVVDFCTRKIGKNILSFLSLTSGKFYFAFL